MAGSSYSNGRGRLGFRVWGTPGDGLETRDGWSNSAYLNRAEVNHDNVCRPVINDSDGRAMPGVIDCPNHQKDSTAMNGFPNKGGNYQSGSHYGGDKPRVQEVINNVQNAANDGGRAGLPAGIFQHQKFNHGGYGAGANDMSNNGWNRPAYRRYESLADNMSAEPALITTGGWARPGCTGWPMPTKAPLGKATNDTGTAAEDLTESARPSLGGMAGAAYWNPALPNTYQPKKRNSVTTTIDRREAARKYGGMFV